MRLLLAIDSFNSGGAQRQMVELACGLKQHGHDVEMVVYFPEHDAFRARVDAHHIRVHEFTKQGRFDPRLVGRLARLFRAGRYDVVVSYLKSVNVYVELAGLLARGTTLVVSERTSYHDDSSRSAALVRRILHGRAAHVVTNSMTQCDYLRKKWWLRKKVSCIYNGLDLGAFAPGDVRDRPVQPMRLLGVGRIGPEKNLPRLIEALDLCQREFNYAPVVSWAGKPDMSPAGVADRRIIDDLLEQLPDVRARWHWLGGRADIPQLMHSHDALIHPSLYEGLPNVVCEALATGLPVLASAVCDHPYLVADGQRGFLFDPVDAKSIAAAIGKLAALDGGHWRELSRNAREYAVANLGATRMVGAYEALFASLTAGDADGRANRQQL